ncbi:hypothetical protein AO263_30510 [Pseudomonas sp. NZIPFR-PS5]|nr:hypothetical protein AO263_30510 [Pseudomonas sp. NZIPFR-PS5]
MNERTEHDIVLDGEYVGAVNAGGSHWRLRLILKQRIIQDCAPWGNAGLPAMRLQSEHRASVGMEEAGVNDAYFAA